MNMRRLGSDAIAVLTGASSGIGRAIALTLLRRRLNVHALGRHPTELDAASQRHGTFVHHHVDLEEDEEIREVVSRLCADLHRVDVLVHAAGVIRLAKLENLSTDDFDIEFRVNARAPFLLTRGLLPLLRAARGQIVFINSSASQHTSPDIGAYAASKAALKSLTDALRQEVNDSGIRVLSVYPGRTASPMQEAVHRWESKPYDPTVLLQPADVAEAVLHALEAPRTAELTDLHIRPLHR